jgi:hypothetical protein
LVPLLIAARGQLPLLTKQPQNAPIMAARDGRWFQLYSKFISPRALSEV